MDRERENTSRLDKQAPKFKIVVDAKHKTKTAENDKSQSVSAYFKGF
jgi:hypothetical protein